MTPGRASRTAEHMALFRAVETARPATSRLFADPFATRFLRPRYRAVALLSRVPFLHALVERRIDRLVPGARTSAVARTRLIDDAVSAALAATKQLVILGAGYDCRAYRIPALARLPVFEVDHPDTLREKRRRLARTRLEHVRFVGADFDRQSAADALATSDYEPARRTFFIWEGVTNYLTASAVDATFRWLGTAAAGSTVAFTYVHRSVLDAPGTFDGAERLLRELARFGEPWTFGLDPAETPSYLGARGLTLVEDLGADEYRQRYLADRTDGRRGYAFYRVAVATVADRPTAG